MNCIVFSLFILLYLHLNNIVCVHNHVNSNKPLTGPSSSSLSNQQTNNLTYFQSFLDPFDDYRLFWSVDYDARVISIEMRIILKRKSNWFAIGLSDFGEPNHADFCLYWTDHSGQHHFQDIWTDSKGFTNLDNQDDCQLIDIKVTGKVVRFLFQRDFETCDKHDRPIEDGTNHIVYAEGTGPIKHAYGLNVYKANYGFQRAQFLKPLRNVPPLPANVRVLDIALKEVTIPKEETTYWCKLVKFPEVISQKHHIVRYEANIQVGNEALIHHMELFHCEVDESLELPSWDASCYSPEKPKILESCKRVLSAWAMGAGPFSYPAEAGLPIGGSNFSRYAMLEVHYNNPELRSGVKDSSGLRIYFTPNLRQFDVGVLEVGLTYTDKNSIPPGQTAFNLSGYCVAECTRVSLPSKGITVFASQLHTHLTGRRVWTKHFRGGIELPEINRDNHYSTHFQEIRILKKPVTVLPGDVLINTCQYDTTDRVKITLGGFGIRDEMCVNYMHYYPKSELEICKSSIDSEVLARYFDYLSINEGQNTSSKFSVADNFGSIQWTRHSSRFLYKLYMSSPLSMQCRRSDGEFFPGNWEGTALPEIRVPFMTKSRCSSPDLNKFSEKR